MIRPTENSRDLVAVFLGQDVRHILVRDSPRVPADGRESERRVRTAKDQTREQGGRAQRRPGHRVQEPVHRDDRRGAQKPRDRPSMRRNVISMSSPRAYSPM